MDATLERIFLNHSVEKLNQYTGRIETCLNMLNEDQIWARGNQNENAIGNLVLHLCGNVRQWLVSGVGGKPDHRERDKEFAAKGGVPSAELLERLRSTVREAADTILPLTTPQLLQPLSIQKYDVTAFEAIYHVVEHFSMHTGQILFATKMLTGADLGFYRHLQSNAAHGETTP